MGYYSTFRAWFAGQPGQISSHPPTGLDDLPFPGMGALPRPRHQTNHPSPTVDANVQKFQQTHGFHPPYLSNYQWKISR